MKFIFAIFAMMVSVTAVAKTYTVDDDFCHDVNIVSSIQAQNVMEDYVLGYEYTKGDFQSSINREIDDTRQLILKTHSYRARQSLVTIQKVNYWLSLNAAKFDNYVIEALSSKNVEVSIEAIGAKMAVFECKEGTTFEYTPTK